MISIREELSTAPFLRELNSRRANSRIGETSLPTEPPYLEESPGIPPTWELLADELEESEVEDGDEELRWGLAEIN